MTAVVREVVAFAPTATRYGAVCGSVGAVAGLMAPFLTQPPVAAFAFGFLLPLGPMVLLLSSAGCVRRDLRRWEQWHKAGLITRSELRELRRATLQAMTTRWYGPKADAPPDGPLPEEAGGPVGAK